MCCFNKVNLSAILLVHKRIIAKYTLFKFGEARNNQAHSVHYTLPETQL